MSDSKLDELIIDVGRLQQQMHDLYALHRQLQHGLDDVLEKINRLKPEASMCRLDEFQQCGALHAN
jgi:hypothetical protein